MSIAPNTTKASPSNKKLLESLNIKPTQASDEPQHQIQGASVTEEPKKSSASTLDSFVNELIEQKRKQKKARLEPVMTHLRADVNEALEDLVSKSGLTKSKVVAQIIMKTLGMK